MSSYSPSTIARISDIALGIQVDTGALLGTTYLQHSGTPQHELFTVKGRIRLVSLVAEIITADISTTACTMVWNATFSSTAYTIQPIGTKCTTMSGMKVGHRVVWGGGILATIATLTTKPYLSDYADVTPMIIGGIDSVGTIGMLCEAATVTTGSLKCSLRYFQDSPGAYVEALV